MNDISSNLKAKLRGIAKDLVEGKMTEIGLHDEGFQFNNHALRAQIIELLNQYVQELSSEEEQVEVVDYKRVKRRSGPCIYFTITSPNDQKGQLFYIGCYRPGIGYCEWATEDEYREAVECEDRANLQREQARIGKELLTNDLALRLLGKLSAALENEAPDSCRRANAEYHLRSIEGKKNGFSGSDIEKILAAYAALELDLPTLS